MLIQIPSCQMKPLEHHGGHKGASSFSTKEWRFNLRLNHYITCSSSQSMPILEVFSFKYYLSLAVDHNVWLLRFPKSSHSESRSVVQHHLSLELEISQSIFSSHLEVHVQSHH